MSISENIKRIRVKLNLTQQEFAERLGLKRNTVATYEMGRSEPSESAKMLICREFGIRREWLETGEGEMTPNKSSATLEQLAQEYQLDERSRTLIENFLRLTPENRQMVLAAFDNAARLLNGEPPLGGEKVRKSYNELTPEEMHARLDEEIDRREKNRARLSVSTITNGLYSKKINGSS